MDTQYTINQIGQIPIVRRFANNPFLIAILITIITVILFYYINRPIKRFLYLFLATSGILILSHKYKENIIDIPGTVLGQGDEVPIVPSFSNKYK
jgi:hypothetical protein